MNKRLVALGAVAAVGLLAAGLTPALASSGVLSGHSGAAVKAADATTAPDSALAKIRTGDPNMVSPAARKGLARANISKAVAAKPRVISAGVTVPLPLTGFTSYGGAVAVDDANQQVFIAGGQQNDGGSKGIVVTDFDGTVKKTIETDTGVTGLFVDSASGTLYASLYDSNAIAAIDLKTLSETKRWPCPDNDQPQALVVIGGTVWIQGYAYITSLVLATGVETQNSVTSDRVVAVPGHPDWLLGGAEHSAEYAIDLYDISSGTPTSIAHVQGSGTLGDLAVSADGASVYAGGLGKILHTSDLSAESTYTPKDIVSGSIAAGSASFAVGVGPYISKASPNLVIYPVGSTTALAQFTLAQPPVSHGLAYSGDGSRLFVVTTDGTTVNLVVEADVDKTQTNVSLPVPHKLVVGKGVTVAGSISFENESYDGKTRTLHVSRIDKTGTHTLPDVTTNSGGAFTFTDAASLLGRVTYSVTYDGDATHATVTQTAFGLREVPFDVNGDGYADLVVGSPGEDIGSATNTGAIDVLYGNSSGVSGIGSKEYDQGTAGVPGTSETGDQFGWSQVSGDFNADGYPDVAVSANAEDNGEYTDSGSIWIFYGSASGLRTTGITTISEANFDHGDGWSWNDAFMGEVMTVGDFNGDGLVDLATSVFGEVNEVAIAYGTPAGLSSTATLFRFGASFGFGSSLSAGDVNGDGSDDLAIGSPYDLTDKGYDAGAAYIAYGSASGLSTTGVQEFDKDTSGVPGSPKPYGKNDAPDSFGYQVDLADFNGDGKADLVVSAPGSPVVYGGSTHEDAGTVTVLYSTGTKIGTTNAAEVNQGTTGMPGSPGKGDAAGVTMAVGDSNGDGKADVAIFSPGDTYVTVVKGSSAGLSFSTAAAWTQNSSGVPGTSETGDAWGDSLRFENFKGAGPQALAVGADGENGGAGAVTVLYATSSGLTGTGSGAFSQNSSGVSGTAEAGDWFGSFYSW